MGSDFATPFMAGARGIAMVRREEHRACTHGAHSVVTVAHAEVVPSGAQRLAGACATIRQ